MKKVKETKLKITRKEVKNTSDVDIYVRDAYGKEHIIFPKQEMVISVVDRS